MCPCAPEGDKRSVKKTMFASNWGDPHESPRKTNLEFMQKKAIRNRLKVQYIGFQFPSAILFPCSSFQSWNSCVSEEFLEASIDHRRVWETTKGHKEAFGTIVFVRHLRPADRETCWELPQPFFWDELRAKLGGFKMSGFSVITLCFKFLGLETWKW